MTSNLDSFVNHSKPQPSPLATSKEIHDRESTFIGYLYRVNSLPEMRGIVNHLKRVEHAGNAASHYISAWRFMRPKPGSNGLDVDDFVLESGCLDDNEQWAGAKARVLKAMEVEGALDIVVIVARWYGGIQLGPVRFTHIHDCAREVCQSFVRRDEMEDCIAALKALDESITGIRSQMAEMDETTSATPAKIQDYTTLLDSLDIVKARRLVTARENSLKSVKLMLAKRQSAG